MALLLRRRSPATRMLYLATLLAALAITSPTPSGQSSMPDPEFDAKGFQQTHDYYSPLPFEHVDTVNGNLVLTFTDLVLPGNAGFDVRFTRAYNAKDGRWTFGVAGLPLGVGPYEPQPATDPEDRDHWVLPQFFTADGSDPSALWKDAVGQDQELITSQFWLYHTPSRTLRFPNGLVATFTPVSAMLARLSEVTDPFGNSVSFQWNANGLETVTQDLGNDQVRTVTFTYDGGQFPRTMTSEGRTWTYTHDPAHNWQLVSAAPPEGPAWQFGYDGGFSVRTPQGGAIAYTFIEHYFERDQPWLPGLPTLIPTTVLNTRTTSGPSIRGGTWIFTFHRDPSHVDRLEVEGPVNTIVYRANWDAGHLLPVSRKTQSGAAVLQDEALAYTPIHLGPGLGEEYELPVIASHTIVRDGQAFSTAYEYHGANYGDFGSPWRIIESNGRTTTVQYKHDFVPYIRGKVEGVTVSVGSESYSESLAHSAWTGFTESRTTFGIPTTFEPDARGNVAAAIDARSNRTGFTYAWGTLKDTNTPAYPIGRGINATGTVASETRGGFTTAFQYDAFGRTTRVIPPGGQGLDETVTTYNNGTGRDVTVERGPSRVTTTSDGFGRPIHTANAVGVQTDVEYDAAGRKTYESYPYTSSNIGDTFAYDALGRLTQIAHPDGKSVRYAYSGATVTLTDEENRQTTQYRSAFGDPDDSRLSTLVDANAKAWGYNYDAIGNLMEVVPPDGTPHRTWIYAGGSHRLTRESQPESGTTTYGYDGAGNLTWKHDARGQDFAYDYDANNRLTRIDAPGTAHDVTEIQYNAFDSRTHVRNGFVESTFTYDAANRLRSRTDIIQGHSFRVRYEYDGRDNPIETEYPNAREVAYAYDAGNRVTRVSDAAHTFADQISYHASGAVASYRYGNGQAATLDFDDRYRPSHLATGPLTLDYRYDGVGNVQSISDARDDRNQTFTYDALDRLTEVNGWGAKSYAYDALGNRTNGTDASYRYSTTTTQLLSVAGAYETDPDVQWDPNGNLARDRSGSYTYTPFNMLETATVGTAASTTYRYDADQARALRIGSGGPHYFINSGGELLAEYDEANGQPVWTRDYVYLGSRLLASVSPPRQAITVGFPSASASVAETAGTYTATVRVTTEDNQPLTRAVAVGYGTVTGTAVAGSDFTAVSGTLTFAAGSVSGASQTIGVPIVDDAVYDPGDAFELRLANTPDAAVGIATQTISITDNEAPPPEMSVDIPATSSNVHQRFTIAGWAIDRAASSGPGVDTLHVWAYPRSGSVTAPIFLGAAAYGGSRPDVGAVYGAPFTNSGFSLTVELTTAGLYEMVVYAHSTVSGTFNQERHVFVTVTGDPRMNIDVPGANATVGRSFALGGWAIDLAAASGPGTDAIHVWAFPSSGGPPEFVGYTFVGADRWDVAAAFGSSQFRYSGFNLLGTLAPGTYQLMVFAHSSVTGTFNQAQTRTITVQ